MQEGGEVKHPNPKPMNQDLISDGQESETSDGNMVQVNLL